jgi:hypothetical protein
MRIIAIADIPKQEERVSVLHRSKEHNPPNDWSGAKEKMFEYSEYKSP